VAIVGLTLAAALAIAYWLTRGDWLHGLLAGLTLAMAVLPEELPVVLTLFLGLGAWRLAHRAGSCDGGRRLAGAGGGAGHLDPREPSGHMPGRDRYRARSAIVTTCVPFVLRD